MSQVKLSLDELNTAEKIDLANAIKTAMTGNANFTAPSPPLATLAANITALQTAITNKTTADQAAAIASIAVHNAETALDATLTAEGAYVQGVSQGNESIILSAGMNVRATPGKVGPLPAPGGLSATNGDLPGEIDLHWNPVRGSRSYALRQTVDPITPTSVWTALTPSTKSKYSVLGLTGGTRYWFEVAAVGAAGQGPWSDPATKMAQG